MHRCFAIPLMLAAGAAGAQPVDGVVEIGGLTPIAADAYGRAASVVTAEEIAERQFTHVADVLRTLPGVQVSRAGTAGGITAIRLRGAEGNHTLVLVDGVEVAAPELGEYDFSGLLAADIERIEVLRGPQSALWGSNSIGGVVAITTRRSETPGQQGRATAEGGDDGTLGGSLWFGTRGERGRVDVTIAARETGGFDVSGDPGGGADRDRNVTVGFSAEHRLGEALTLSGLFRHIDRASDYDPEAFGAPDRDALVVDGDFVRERDETLASVGALTDLWRGRAEAELRLDAAEFDDRNYEDGEKITDTSGSRRFALLRTTLALDAPFVAAADHTLTLALDWERDAFQADDPDLVFDPSQLERIERETLGGVVEYRGALPGGLDLQLGIRRDLNDGFEDATTWAAGASYPLSAATRLHTSAGTGVQAPTLFDQFGFFPGLFVGNPDLEPEENFGWDIGVEHRLPMGVIDLTYFRQTLQNEIATVFDAGTGLSAARNEEGESERQGVEVAASFELGERVTLGLDYTWLDAEDPDGGREVRRPRQSLGLDLAYLLPGGRTEFVVGVEHVAGLVDFDFTAPSFGAERVELDDYTLVDVAARHRLTDTLDLTARVTNVFDVEHEEVYGYESQGRTAHVGLAARF